MHLSRPARPGRASRAKQQAEGGGVRWILSALIRLNYSTRPPSSTALSRLGCASERTWVDGRWAATSTNLPCGPTHDYATAASSLLCGCGGLHHGFVQIPYLFADQAKLEVLLWETSLGRSQPNPQLNKVDYEFSASAPAGRMKVSLDSGRGLAAWHIVSCHPPPSIEESTGLKAASVTRLGEGRKGMRKHAITLDSTFRRYCYVAPCACRRQTVYPVYLYNEASADIPHWVTWNGIYKTAL